MDSAWVGPIKEKVAIQKKPNNQIAFYSLEEAKQAAEKLTPDYDSIIKEVKKGIIYNNFKLRQTGDFKNSKTGHKLRVRKSKLKDLKGKFNL